MANDTVYIYFKQSCKVDSPYVHVDDIASVISSDKILVNKIKVLRVLSFSGKQKDRKIFSAIKILELILKAYPYVTLEHIGEPEILIEYDPALKPNKALEYAKLAAVCIILFFGSGFSIMSFNNDVDVHKLFSDIYQQITGSTSDGFTIIEVAYCIGIWLGILTFYNHFGKKRITSDPSPVEVELRQYESDINSTLIDGIRREETHIDVD